MSDKGLTITAEVMALFRSKDLIQAMIQVKLMLPSFSDTKVQRYFTLCSSISTKPPLESLQRLPYNSLICGDNTKEKCRRKSEMYYLWIWHGYQLFRKWDITCNSVWLKGELNTCFNEINPLLFNWIRTALTGTCNIFYFRFMFMEYREITW